MAQTYAGILGPLAFLTSLARGILHGGGPDSVLWSAWCSLVAFALVGGVVGWLAQGIVEDSVHGLIAEELEAQSKTPGPPTGKGAANVRPA